ncbi:MAG: DUF58 domain-containing protein [Chitinophagales bacterium]|nr:DUF58 domain-containing protein [Chitinophagales bacterium]
MQTAIIVIVGLIIVSIIIYIDNLLLAKKKNIVDITIDNTQKTSDLLKKVRKIEIKTKGITNHIFSGEYHSKFKGRGMSFSEVREYQYGDDIRNIDWNVTARFHQPFVKVFEEERELTVMLLVDVSKSSFIGTNKQTKKEIIAEICAVIAFSAINNNDKVGLLFFSDQTELYIAPQKGKKHILRLIRELLDYQPKSGQTNIAKTLEGFNNKMRKKSIVFILSDFLLDDYFDSLSHLAKKHDVVGIKVYDQLDEAIPNIGLLQVHDVESGHEVWLDTNNKTMLNEYKDKANAYQTYFEQSFGKAGADKIEIKTGEPYIYKLMKFFKGR